MSQDKVSQVLKDSEQKVDNVVRLLKEAVSNAQAFSNDMDRLREAHRLTPFEFCIALIVSESAAERAFPAEYAKAKQLMSERIIDGKFERTNSSGVGGRDQGETPKA